MSYFDFSIKQGDVLPVLTDTLTYSDGSPANLTGASVNFVMRQVSALAPAINTPAIVTDAAAGGVSYTFTAGNTATAGPYTASWVVTFSGGQQQQWPTDGYLEINIEENLTTTGGQTIVSLGAVKEYLNIPSQDRTNDSKLLRFIRASVPVIEAITGPIVQQTFEEFHDGGHYRIVLRRRPSSAYGTSPFLIVNAVSEYNGPIEWPLAIVSTLDEAVLYSVMVDTNLGWVTRTTAGGGVQDFPNMPNSVHVWYTAGQTSIPENVRQANLELLRINYQRTQQRVSPGWGASSGAGEAEDDAIPSTPMGFFVPGRVRELLAVNRRAPACA